MMIAHRGAAESAGSEQTLDAADEDNTGVVTLVAACPGDGEHTADAAMDASDDDQDAPATECAVAAEELTNVDAT